MASSRVLKGMFIVDDRDDDAFNVRFTVTKKDLNKIHAQFLELQMKKISKDIKLNIVYIHIQLLKECFLLKAINNILNKGILNYEAIIMNIPFMHNNTPNLVTKFSPRYSSYHKYM
eukprot:52917_1